MFAPHWQMRLTKFGTPNITTVPRNSQGIKGLNNCNNLILHKCNPEIFNTLSSNKRSQDIKAHKMSSALLSVLAITGIAEQLLSIRANKELSGSEVRKCLRPIVQSSLNSLAMLSSIRKWIGGGGRT